MKTLPEGPRDSLPETSSYHWGGIWRVNLRGLPGGRGHGAQSEGRDWTRQAGGLF